MQIKIYPPPYHFIIISFLLWVHDLYELHHRKAWVMGSFKQMEKSDRRSVKSVLGHWLWTLFALASWFLYKKEPATKRLMNPAWVIFTSPSLCLVRAIQISLSLERGWICSAQKLRAADVATHSYVKKHKNVNSYPEEPKVICFIGSKKLQENSN